MRLICDSSDVLPKAVCMQLGETVVSQHTCTSNMLLTVMCVSLSIGC